MLQGIRYSASPRPNLMRAMFDSLRESFATCRHYEQLRSRGMAHETALREALGVGPARAPARRAATTLCFAGRA